MDETESCPLGIIPARTIRQAMDWSLVLFSQGIQSELHETVPGRGAELRVAAEHHARCLQILEQYQRENRHRRWQRPVPRTGFVFDWQSLGWGVLLCVLYSLQSADGSILTSRGQYDSLRVHAGEWWRSFTALSLHSDIRHLASNVSTGLVFLGLAMVEYGAGQALLAMTLAGALANGVGLALRSGPYFGLGASGAVMAALGLIAVRAFRWQEWRERPALATARGIVAGGLLLVLLGFSPQGDVLVHVAGFILGCAFGLVLKPFVGFPRRQSRWDLPAKILFTIVFSGAWYLALRNLPRGG